MATSNHPIFHRGVALTPIQRVENLLIETLAEQQNHYIRLHNRSIHHVGAGGSANSAFMAIVRSDGTLYTATPQNTAAVRSLSRPQLAAFSTFYKLPTVKWLNYRGNSYTKREKCLVFLGAKDHVAAL